MDHRCHRRTDLMRGRTGDGDEECREIDVPVRQGGGRKTTLARDLAEREEAPGWGLQEGRA